MSIGFESPAEALRKLRERLLCGLRVSGGDDPYKVQLLEARAEWRRRHPRIQ
jgi:hypothetical protein